jgi:maltose-binding protein MalE
MVYAPTNVIQSVINELHTYNNKHIAEFTLNSNVLYYVKKFVNNEEFTKNDIENLNARFYMSCT